MANVVKWTWFHKNCFGKNVVAQNTILGVFIDRTIAELDFAAECAECVERRGFTLSAEKPFSKTFIGRSGDFVNVRLVS